MGIERERKNVFGEEGCRLPDGGLCDVCCIIYRHYISNEVCGLVEFKEAGVPCPHLNKFNGGGEGCMHHGKETKPKVCREFHCGKCSDPSYIIAGAYALGKIDEEMLYECCRREGFNPDLVLLRAEFIKSIKREIPSFRLVNVDQP